MARILTWQVDRMCTDLDVLTINLGAVSGALSRTAYESIEPPPADLAEEIAADLGLFRGPSEDVLQRSVLEFYGAYHSTRRRTRGTLVESVGTTVPKARLEGVQASAGNARALGTDALAALRAFLGGSGGGSRPGGGVGVWILGVVMAVSGLAGLFLASRARAGSLYVFGLGLFTFGVGFVFWLIRRHVGRVN